MTETVDKAQKVIGEVTGNTGESEDEGKKEKEDTEPAEDEGNKEDAESAKGKTDKKSE